MHHSNNSQIKRACLSHPVLSCRYPGPLGLLRPQKGLLTYCGCRLALEKGSAPPSTLLLSVKEIHRL